MLELDGAAGTSARRALSELDTAEWAREWQLPAYRGRQLAAAIWKRAVHDVDELTELPATLRDILRTNYEPRTLRAVTHLRSAVDGAEKVLFELRGGGTVETVLIPARNAGGGRRLTVCVSSQVGCPAGCTFCATGLSGFMRNLTSAEITDQVMYFAHELRRTIDRITNVVYMGMGEPFMNPVAVRESVAGLTDPARFGLGERSVTVSTVGIIPQIQRFGSWAGQVNLAVSLHAPNDELRSQLVPYNRHFPIEPLIASVRAYTEHTHRRVSFEYVLLRGVNDSLVLASDLATLLRPLGPLGHVNLIPWNPFIEGRFVRSEGLDAEGFAEVVRRAGVNASVRYSRGLDISAACGQLRDQIRTRASGGAL